VRTFVAIELDEASRRRCGAALRDLAGAVRAVRWVKPDAAHLTLKFIGELAEQELPAAICAIRAATAPGRPFLMTLAGLSGFPPRGGARVVYVPVLEPTGELAALAERVDRSLSESLGIAREKRPFQAHVTLGRARRHAQGPPAAQIAELLADSDFGQVTVRSVVLMKSDLTPAGALYTPLERFGLGGPPEVT